MSSTNIQRSNHPLLLDYVFQLRDKNTDTKTFRALVKNISRLLCYEATIDLQTKSQPVTTPLTTTDAPCLVSKQMMLVPIIRAGLAMVEGMIDLMPDASIGYIGLKRDEQTLEPVQYYKNFPMQDKQAPVLVCDPMLATGGSLLATIDSLHDDGCRNIKVAVIFAVPEGIAALQQKYPDIVLHTAVIDEKLNEKGYIIPGVGDAGDRLWGAGSAIVGDDHA